VTYPIDTVDVTKWFKIIKGYCRKGNTNEFSISSDIAISN
jgi:hypothetical protein